MKDRFDRFNELYKRIKAKGNSKEVFDLLKRMYSEKHRAYHNLSHIEKCLNEFDDVRCLLKHPNEVETALWFHDAVYDTKSKSNEEKSAELAYIILKEMGLEKQFGEMVYKLILATKHNLIAKDIDARVLADIDLSILGKSSKEFNEYERAIREEYSWASKNEFIAGRTAFLNTMLKKPNIYSTAFFKEKYENQARKNIQISLERLKAG